MSNHQQQADSEIHEDQLLNFLVNRLDEEVSLNLANNAEIDPEGIHEVSSPQPLRSGVGRRDRERGRCGRSVGPASTRRWVGRPVSRRDVEAWMETAVDRIESETDQGEP